MNCTQTTGRLNGWIRAAIGMGIWLVLFANASVEAQQSRLWRDNTGTFDVVAVLLAVNQDSIVLQLTDGRTITSGIPFFKRSWRFRVLGMFQIVAFLKKGRDQLREKYREQQQKLRVAENQIRAVTACAKTTFTGNLILG